MVATKGHDYFRYEPQVNSTLRKNPRRGLAYGPGGSSPRNGVIIIIITVVEAARLRGAQMVSWTEQKHSLVHIPSPPYRRIALASAYQMPACIARAHPSRASGGDASLGGQGEKNRRSPGEKAGRPHRSRELA